MLPLRPSKQSAPPRYPPRSLLGKGLLGALLLASLGGSGCWVAPSAQSTTAPIARSGPSEPAAPEEHLIDRTPPPAERPPPAGGGADEPASLFRQAMGDRDPGRVSGALSTDLIREQIRGAIGEARLCFERHLEGHPGSAGRMALRFVIGPGGAVQEVSVTSSDFDASAFERCMGEFIRGLTFQPPGGVVVVTYPFAFRPEGTPAVQAGVP